MRVLVTGACGQLGTDLCCELRSRNIEVIGIDMADADLTGEAATLAVITKARPDAIIHCAAYTAVDRAEDEIERVRAINAGGTRHVAEAARELHCKLMYISTDYVFDGSGTRPWEVDDKPCPLDAYGQTKYEGELAVRELVPEQYFIVRISWVFGPHGHNFVKTMLKLSESHDEINVVSDQVGSPTYTPDLSRLLADMIVTDRYGTYHATNEGLCSWSEFATEIFRQAGRHVTVTPVTTKQYGAKAARPLNSRMSKESLDAAGFARLPSWQDALTRMLAAPEVAALI